jgi:hypothetical protein
VAKEYNDNFTRADDAVKLGLSSDGLFTWQPTSGTGQSIESNEAKLVPPAVSAYGYGDVQEQVDTDSMFAEYDVASVNIAGSAFAFYMAICHPNDDTSGYFFGHSASSLTAGSYTAGAVDTAPVASLVGDRVRIVYREAFDYLGVYLNGAAVASATISTEATGAGKRGVQVSMVDDNTASYFKFANFRCGDLPARANALKRYVKVVSLTAYAISGYGSDYSTIAELDLLLGGTPLSRSGWSVTASDEDPFNPASNMLDGNAATFWQSEVVGTPSQPHHVILDCGAAVEFDSVRVRNRNDDDFGSIGRYEVYLSDDGVTWGDPIRAGTMNAGTPSLGADFDLYLEILAGDPATDQHSYRFYNDDGNAAGATAAAALNTPASLATGVNMHLRTLLNFSGDMDRKAYKLQYRKVGDATWKDVTQ